MSIFEEQQLISTDKRASDCLFYLHIGRSLKSPLVREFVYHRIDTLFEKGESHVCS